MADDSELDYLKTFLQFAVPVATVNHFSEKRKIDLIDDNRRILIFPAELISVDGKFYKKRYKIQISETSEANLMETFNLILRNVDLLQRQAEPSSYDSGRFFSVSGEMSSPRDGCWDGTYFWIVGSTNKRVYKYNSAGVYQSTNFDVSSECGSPRSVCWDGTYFWVLDSDDRAFYKYNSAGVYQSASITTLQAGFNQRGITWDGTYFWVSGDSDDSLNKYDSSGTFIETIDISTETISTQGICWDGTFLWVVGENPEYLFKYDSNGSFIEGVISHDDINPVNGVMWDGIYLKVIGLTDKKVHEFSRTIYTKPDTLLYITFRYGNRAFENGKTKRWYQDLFIDVEWSIE